MSPRKENLLTLLIVLVVIAIMVGGATLADAVLQ